MDYENLEATIIDALKTYLGNAPIDSGDLFKTDAGGATRLDAIGRYGSALYAIRALRGLGEPILARVVYCGNCQGNE